MNTRNLGGSIWLLLFGTATVLLIGAFARFDTPGTPTVTDTNAPVSGADLGPATTFTPIPDPATPSTVGPTLPADLSPGLADVIKLAQAHIGEDTILTYIQNSGQTYNPSANELLYLSDIGVSEAVLAALERKPDAAMASTAIGTNSPAPQPAATAMIGAPDTMIDKPLPTDDQPAPVQNPQNNYFYDSLTPYGSWVDVGQGYAWQPSVAAAESDWQPYVNRGHWVLTEDGWCWVSDYSWGWAPFHYGRWSQNPRFGWVWVPGNVWAPAWVAWRETEGFAGWAALPPGVLFRPGVGLFTVAGLPGLKLSFGINAERFTFVPHEHFLSQNLGRFATSGKRNEGVFHNSHAIGGTIAANGRVRNNGVSAETIATATKVSVPKLAVHEVTSGTSSGSSVVGKDLTVYRPNVAPSAAPRPSNTGSKPILINGSSPISRAPSTARTPFISSNFEPPVTRQTHAPTKPAPFLASRDTFGSGGAQPLTLPRGPAPGLSYPTFSPNQGNDQVAPSRDNLAPRNFNSSVSQAPIAKLPAPSENNFAQRSAGAFNSAGPSNPRESQSGGYAAPQHNNAPAYTAPAPSHGNGGGSGGGNSGSSSPSSNSSKNNR